MTEERARESAIKSLTEGRLLAKNGAYNFLGQAFSMVLAFIVIPILIRRLGINRFGILTLVWMVMGYFSIFDFGLGRAVTQLLSKKLATGKDDEIPEILHMSLLLMLLTGLTGTVVGLGISRWLIMSVLKIPPENKHEALIVLRLMMFSLPFDITTSGFRGILSSYQRFDIINILRIPMGIISYLGPLSVLLFSNSLVVICLVIFAGRILSWLANLLACIKIVPTMRQRVRFRKSTIIPLVSFGGWMTVSNLTAPVMVYMDRFLIGAAISIAAMAYYTTPYDTITKLWIVPTAVLGTLFPAFANSFFSSKAHAARLFDCGMRYVILILFPAVLLVVTFAHEGLSLWLGEEFSRKSALVLQLLAAGVFINSMAYLPSAMLQGAGRADITAKLQMAELPVYIIILFWLVNNFGIKGAAVAWMLRVTVDAAALFIISARVLSEAKGFIRNNLTILSVALLSLLPAALYRDIAAKTIYAFVVLFGFALYSWLSILASEERAMVINVLRLRLRAEGEK